jgi:ATP/maltotriose-dependent transcriptional regulator MalT
MVAGSATAARRHAVRSAQLAADAGDRHTEVMALTQQAALELFLGIPGAERSLARSLAAPHDPLAMADHNGPLYARSRFHLAHDRLDDAGADLRALVYTLRQRGSAESLGQCLCGLAQVEVHRGRCRQALTVARHGLRAAEQSGLSQGPAWYTVALAEAAGGSFDEALAAAEKARRHSEDEDDRLFLPRALHAEGRIRLLRGEEAAAAELLRAAGGMETAQGLGDPAVRRWHGDLAEALARVGALAEADEVVARARTQAARLARRSVLAAVERAAALVGEARGDLDAAARGLETAAAAFHALPYPLEEAATLLALGRVLRRREEPRASRAALAGALRIFTRCGARPWVAVTLAERNGTGAGPAGAAPPRPPGVWADRLTVTERSVVTRVAQGASNREIAASLVVSVKTVEAALTRVYRKLGVRSRVEIARLVMTAGAG